MSTDDDRTAQLLTQALAEQADLVGADPGALQVIQRRIESAAGSRTRWGRFGRHPRVLGAFAAGLATAAVITTVVLVGHNGGHRPTPAANRPGTGHSSAGVVQPGSKHQGVYNPSAEAQARVTMYYLGFQPTNGPVASRLYSETHTVALLGGSHAVAAVHEFLMSKPIDPDYSSGWPAGVDVSTITDNAGVTTINLIGGGKALGTTPDNGFHSANNAVAVQALMATAGVKGKASFTLNGKPLSLLLHTDVSPTISTASEDTLRAFVSIDNIVDGQTLTNPVTALVSGNTFEGTVNWELLDRRGTKVDSGNVITSMGSWRQVGVHLGTLVRGRYTFKAFDYSPDDGSPIDVDDKAFTVQ